MTTAIGLDLGGTNIKAAVVRTEADITIIETASVPTHAERGPEAVTQTMSELAVRMRQAHPQATSLGIGVPGLFDYNDGTVVFFTNLPGAWEGMPLRTALAEGAGLPTTLINDARAFTLAESVVGAGAGCATVACVTLGTGIGGGLFINGQLHFGAFGVAGEIGHQTLVADGPPCGCGNPGCLEALARPPAVANLAGAASFEEVIALADDGDPQAQRALASAIEALGIGLANVVTMVGPERIVIGGGASQAGERLIGPIREAVRARVTLVPPELVEVVAATLGSTAGAVGAALASIDLPATTNAFLTGEVPSAKKRRAEVSDS